MGPKHNLKITLLARPKLKTYQVVSIGTRVDSRETILFRPMFSVLT
jgi:hypothetical protein